MCSIVVSTIGSVKVFSTPSHRVVSFEAIQLYSGLKVSVRQTLLWGFSFVSMHYFSKMVQLPVQQIIQWLSYATFSMTY